MDPTDRAAERIVPPETLEQKVSRLEAENTDLKARLATAEAETKEAKAEAAVDPLTDLPKEKVVLLTLESEMAGVRRGREKLLVLYIDIDHFKEVNDSWGHAHGDQVLADFALAARYRLRAEDMLGRLHGEEFAVIARVGLDNTQDEVRRIIERINQGANMVNRSPDNEPVSLLTVSIGGMVLDSTIDLSVKEIMEAADANLYISKREGRNQASISTPGIEGIEVIKPVQPVAVQPVAV